MSNRGFNLNWAESPAFVAFNAHCWFAYAAVTTAGFLGFNVLTAAALVAILSAAKEFGIDLIFEHDPPQTFGDSLLDWAGYLAGVALGLVAYFVIPLLFWGSLAGR